MQVLHENYVTTQNLLFYWFKISEDDRRAELRPKGRGPGVRHPTWFLTPGMEQGVCDVTLSQYIFWT